MNFKCSNIDKILHGIIIIDQELLKYQKELGFNVFGILDLQEKEWCHSKIIHEFLNPKGSHGKNMMFLNKFFEILNINNKAVNDVDVLYEKSFKYIKDSFDRTGFIDLLIRYKDNGINKCIIIENKINAEDQPKQLIRYYDAAIDGHIYGENNKKIKFKYAKENIYIIYLTLNGGIPSNDSLGDRLCTNNDKIDYHKKKVECISYQEHIIPWLEKCKELLNGSDSISLNCILSQYINILKFIITKISENKYKSKIFDIFAEGENYKFISELRNRGNNLLDKYWNYLKLKNEFLFWKEMEKQINNRNWKLIDSRKYSWNLIVLDKKWYGLKFNQNSSLNRFIYVERGEGRLYCSIQEVDEQGSMKNIKSHEPIITLENINFQKFDAKTHEIVNYEKRKKIVERCLDEIKKLFLMVN